MAFVCTNLVVYEWGPWSSHLSIIFPPDDDNLTD